MSRIGAALSQLWPMAGLALSARVIGRRSILHVRFASHLRECIIYYPYSEKELYIENIYIFTPTKKTNSNQNYSNDLLCEFQLVNILFVVLSSW